MTRGQAEQAVVISALVVGGVWAWRKLIEPATSQAGKAAGSNSQLLKVIGAEPTPANTAEFAVGFGFTYMTLSIGATIAPDVAGYLAVLVAVGDLLINGASVFADINQQLGAGGAETPTGIVASGVKGSAPVATSPGRPATPIHLTPTGQLHG